MIESVEMRNSGRLREIAELIRNVCDTAESSQLQLEMAQLAAGYFKAMFFERIPLANALFEQLKNAVSGYPYDSLEALYETNRISVAELAFCRNYLEIERSEQK